MADSDKITMDRIIAALEWLTQQAETEELEGAATILIDATKRLKSSQAKSSE